MKAPQLQQFSASTRLTSEYEAARLQRMRDEQLWSQFDKPTYQRPRWWRQETNDERRS